MELLSGVGAFGQILINPGSDGYITCPPAPHVVGKLVISAESKTEVRINVINLTRTAQEILRLLPPIDDLRNLTEVAKVISKFASNVSICSIIEVLETGIRVQTIKKISASED